MAYKTSWQADGVVIEWLGDVCAQDILECTNTFASHPNFDSIRWGLHDFTACTSVTSDRRALREAASYVWAASLSNKNIRFASVPNRPDIVAARASFDGARAPSFEHRFFDTHADAYAWLKSERA